MSYIHRLEKQRVSVVTDISLGIVVIAVID